MKKNSKKLLAAVGIPLVCLILTGVILLFAVILPNNRYDVAMTLMEQEKYEEALDAFEALNGYKDSEAKAEQCRLAILEIRYQEAIALLDSGYVLDGCEALRALNGYQNSTEKADAIYSKHQEKMAKVSAAKVGDCVIFGTYEQDGDFTNGKEDIEWIVLAVEDGKALVISKHVLERKRYHDNEFSITWEESSLRAWLNQEFLNAAFCVEERSRIPTVTVPAEHNPDYDSEPGNPTQDQVFLLSMSEAERYFPDDAARLCKPTPYAVSKGVYANQKNGACWWWLRSPGYLQFRGALVHNDGAIYAHGDFVGYGLGAVRPAMWINLES